MTDSRAIAVCIPRPLFVPSVFERRAQDVVDAAGRRGCDAAIVTLPYNSDDPRLHRNAALAWALLDLSDLGTGRFLDAAVCLDPHSLFVHHPRKVVWLTPGWEGDEWLQRALRMHRPGEDAPRSVGPDADADDVVDAALAAGPKAFRAMLSR